MITFHFHLQPQCKYELFHIKFTTVMISIFSPKYSCNFSFKYLPWPVSAHLHADFAGLLLLAGPPHLCLFLKNTVFSVADPWNTRVENEATMLSGDVQKSSRINYNKPASQEWWMGGNGPGEFVQGLHPADAVYHQACNVNFRTGNIFRRSMGMTLTDSKRAKGDPTVTVKSQVF